MDPELKQTLEAMQEMLAALGARVAALESALTAPHERRTSAPPVEPTVAAAPELAVAPAASEAAPPGRADDEIAPEILLAISAAVAAFLGERAHVRQIRLISSPAWGQQGRVNVQASHTLHR